MPPADTSDYGLSPASNCVCQSSLSVKFARKVYVDSQYGSPLAGREKWIEEGDARMISKPMHSEFSFTLKPW